MTALEDYKRLKWRCRRGVKELDLLLQDILDNQFTDFDTDQRRAFSEFLETPDPVILDWVMRRSDQFPARFGFIVKLLTSRA